jgi:hypothetical protein
LSETVSDGLVGRMLALDRHIEVSKISSPLPLADSWGVLPLRHDRTPAHGIHPRTLPVHRPSIGVVSGEFARVRRRPWQPLA